MKRLLFYTLIFVSGISYAQSTLPVIPFGERKADLYYWDTNWFDKYERENLNYLNYPVISAQFHYPADMFLGRTCVANTPIMVKGIAGAVSIQHRLVPERTVDTTISGRRPEEFKLYDANFNLLGESRWDTVIPTYRMEFRRSTERDTFDVYEVYFKPVLVSGQFYVGGTTHNNLYYGRTPELIAGSNFEHLWTVYPGYDGHSREILWCLYEEG